jgi:hypothetical protein
MLKTINRSEWASPMFTVSKTYQTLRSITDLKEVNQKDCYKAYPILKVQKKISTKTAIVSTIISLDINMEYYKII